MNAGSGDENLSLHRPACIRLGVNVDHVATLRNARGGAVPDPLRAAQLRSRRAPTALPRICAKIAAISTTTTCAGSRRHRRNRKPLNFEMAATEQMLDIALENQARTPAALCPKSAPSAPPKAGWT